MLNQRPFYRRYRESSEKDWSLVQRGDLLATLSDNSSLNVYFNISEPEYIDYQQHSAERNKLPLTLILANGSAFSAKGYIQNIAGEFDSSSGNIALRARFANPKGLLRNGETGTVRINMPLHNVLVIHNRPRMKRKTAVMCLLLMARAMHIHVRLKWLLNNQRCLLSPKE